jgi:hypothetical protein
MRQAQYPPHSQFAGPNLLSVFSIRSNRAVAADNPAEEDVRTIPRLAHILTQHV